MSNTSKVRERVKQLLDELPDPYKSKAIFFYTKLLKSRSLLERRVYKARILTYYCQGLKSTKLQNKKEYCKELKNLLRVI